MTRLPLALVPAIAALAILTTPATTLASCMQLPPIEQALQTAEIVFVGTVILTSNRDSWATVEIEEIWKGPDQPANVLVKGGPGGDAATSVDRTFQVGVKYLFFPYPEGATLADNSCTSTTPWSAELLALRPAEVRQPLGATAGEPGDAGFDLGGLIAPLGVALAVAAVLLLVGLAARGRQAG